MKIREVVKLLEADGWHQERQRGSHRIFRHPTKPGSVTVAGKPNVESPTRDVGLDSSAGRSGSVAMSAYAVIYEQGPTSWGAWVPDLPGCIAAGETRAEVEQLIREAIEAHIEDLQEHGETVPPPSSSAGAVQVQAA